MEYRQLGGSGLMVPVLCFGTGTFGGSNEFFKAWGETDVAEATRLIDVCLEAGVNLFDTADIYSDGVSEEILGKAIGKKRAEVLISTKTTFRFGKGPNDAGIVAPPYFEAGRRVASNASVPTTLIFITFTVTMH